jgi:hypothetical protein
MELLPDVAIEGSCGLSGGVRRHGAKPKPWACSDDQPQQLELDLGVCQGGEALDDRSAVLELGGQFAPDCSHTLRAGVTHIYTQLLVCEHTSGDSRHVRGQPSEVRLSIPLPHHDTFRRDFCHVQDLLCLEHELVVRRYNHGWGAHDADIVTVACNHACGHGLSD